jgi:hypothetical protein
VNIHTASTTLSPAFLVRLAEFASDIPLTASQKAALASAAADAAQRAAEGALSLVQQKRVVLACTMSHPKVSLLLAPDGRSVSEGRVMLDFGELSLGNNFEQRDALLYDVWTFKVDDLHIGVQTDAEQQLSRIFDWNGTLQFSRALNYDEVLGTSLVELTSPRVFSKIDFAQAVVVLEKEQYKTLLNTGKYYNQCLARLPKSSAAAASAAAASDATDLPEEAVDKARAASACGGPLMLLEVSAAGLNIQLRDGSEPFVDVLIGVMTFRYEAVASGEGADCRVTFDTFVLSDMRKQATLSSDHSVRRFLYLEREKEGGFDVDVKVWLPSSKAEEITVLANASALKLTVVPDLVRAMSEFFIVNTAAAAAAQLQLTDDAQEMVAPVQKTVQPMRCTATVRAAEITVAFSMDAAQETWFRLGARFDATYVLKQDTTAESALVIQHFGMTRTKQKVAESVLEPLTITVSFADAPSRTFDPSTGARARDVSFVMKPEKGSVALVTLSFQTVRMLYHIAQLMAPKHAGTSEPSTGSIAPLVRAASSAVTIADDSKTAAKTLTNFQVTMPKVELNIFNNFNELNTPFLKTAVQLRYIFVEARTTIGCPSADEVNLEAEVTVALKCYNPTLHAFEPLVEQWDFTVSAESARSGLQRAVSLQGDRVLNINVTPQIVANLVTSSQMWMAEMSNLVLTDGDSGRPTLSEVTPAYILHNLCGADVEVYWVEADGAAAMISHARADEKVGLSFERDAKAVTYINLSETSVRHVCFKVEGYTERTPPIDIESQNRQMFTLAKGVTLWLDIAIERNVKVLRLHSEYSVQNFLFLPVTVRVLTRAGNAVPQELWSMTVPSNGQCALPIWLRQRSEGKWPPLLSVAPTSPAAEHSHTSSAEYGAGKEPLCRHTWHLPCCSLRVCWPSRPSATEADGLVCRSHVRV